MGKFMRIYWILMGFTGFKWDLRGIYPLAIKQDNGKSWIYRLFSQLETSIF
jgi:hypothetical protein